MFIFSSWLLFMEVINMPKWLQIIIGIMSVTASIWAGVWAFTDVIATTKDVKELEQKTITTFHQLNKDFDLKFKQQRLDTLNDRKYRIREEIRKNPNDSILKEDYENIKNDVVIIQKQIDELQKP